jgi:aminoglycoside phosphotransferase (APT) family kinase protein
MTPEWIDQPLAVRPGEEVDAEKLMAYLGEHLPDVSGPIQIQQFPHGHSNLTYLLRIGPKEFVLRRPPFGAHMIRAGHDMKREYRTLRGLSNVCSKVPRPLLYCEDESVLGAPFYIMERVTGVILRATPPRGLDLRPDVLERLSRAFIDTLVEIHEVDYRAAGLADLGRPEGYVQRQIRGWSERYAHSRTDDIPEMERVRAWLEAHRPAESGAALIHNDYKYDNLVLDPTDLSRILAILDWEMATIGDPLMDLGSTLGYWVEADDPPELQSFRFCLTTLPGNFTRAQLVARYAERSGRDVSHILFYYVYALFKIAVIVQQIYFRYHRGFTRDERFARMIQLVRILSRVAVRAIERGRIDRLG